MNLQRVRSLLLCGLPLSLPLFAACNAPVDESADGPDTGDDVGVAAQAVIGTGANTIAAGNQASLVWMSDQTARGCGNNSDGQLGNGSTNAGAEPTLVPVSGLSGVKTVAAASSDYSLALMSNDTLQAWGANTWGQLGDGSSADRHTPVPVVGLSGVTAVAAANAHGLAVTSDGVTANGTVWAWGLNSVGQLGAAPLADGTIPYSRKTPAPVQVQQGGAFLPLSGAVAVAGGSEHSLALKDGAVWAWGKNGAGQLGDDSGVNQHTAVAVHMPTLPSGVFVTAVSAGGWSSLARMSNKTVYAWGRNDHGQLGDGSTTSRPTPVPVQELHDEELIPLTNVLAVAMGYQFSVALKEDGTVWAWGSNDLGQLGDDTLDSRYAAVQVHGLGGVGMLSGVVSVAAGKSHALAQTSDGTVYAWGSNTLGQLGNGTTTYAQSTPVKMLLPCFGAPPVQDQCHLASVCLPTGVWSSPNAANGTGCNDGNACTQIDTCQAGACIGSSPVTCTAQDSCHTAGVCDPATGICPNPVKADGDDCSDGNACTQTDICQSGACIGSNPVTCTAPDPCHPAGICDPDTGACSTLMCY